MFRSNLRKRGIVERLRSPTLDGVAIDISEFAAVLLDLDGTIWHEEVPLPGAVELIARLQTRNQKFAFVTNSGLSPARLRDRLVGMGAKVDASHFYSAASASCDYVRDHFPKGTKVFSVAGSACEELLSDYVEFVQDDQSSCAVVMSASLANKNATAARFQMALRHILRGAAHVALCADRAYPTPRGFEIGSGAVSAMLAYAAGHQPIYCGKPQRVFFDELCQHLGVAPDRCVLIGDNLEADVAGARQMGMKSIVPLTGLTTREMLKANVLGLVPDHVVESLGELK
jgi:HAD superfamily hydrolase (TIGR01450 family)